MSDTDLVVESTAQGGLLGLLETAQSALTRAGTPIGVLRLDWQPDADAPRDIAVGVEAEYTGRGTLARLELRVAQRLARAPADTLLRSALRELGGVAYTSVCITRGPRELADVTVHFGSRVRFLSKCTLLVADALSEADRACVVSVLEALGVRHAEREGSLSASATQLRGALSADAQLGAVTCALDRDLGVQLYASTLPSTRSVQLSIQPEPEAKGVRLELVGVRRAEPNAKSPAGDATALREFLKARFDFELGAKRWSIANAHGEPDEVERRRGPIPDRGRIHFSINWGLKRR